MILKIWIVLLIMTVLKTNENIIINVLLIRQWTRMTNVWYDRIVLFWD